MTELSNRTEICFTPKIPFKILVVDRRKRTASGLREAFAKNVKIDHAVTADTALQMIGLINYNLLILQLKLPLFRGLELAKEMKRLQPDLPILPLNAPDMDYDVEQMTRLGYPTPISASADLIAELKKRCEEYMQTLSWYKRIDNIKNDLKLKYNYDEILSVTDEIKEVYDRSARIADTRTPVLITGESGTGKELVARMIHVVGNRKENPFITVNCAAIPEGLLESQFFGHERGAFTGAVSRQPGKFEQAHTGTLFLDEIGDMNLNLQAKLLRVIERGEFERVGGQETLKVDVRLLTATNRNLKQMADEGDFRSDLLYRINVFPIHLLPLKDRHNDIVLLAYHFLRIASKRNSRQVNAIDINSLELLEQYPWKGNIRELENALVRATLLADGIMLRVKDFPEQLDWMNKEGKKSDLKSEASDISRESKIISLKTIERRAILHALITTGWNIAQAARELEVGRNTLYRKIEEYGLSQEDNSD